MNFVPGTARWMDGTLTVSHDTFSVSAQAAGLRPRLPDGASCWIGIRPEDIHIEADGGAGIPASVYVTEPLGGETVVDLAVGDRVVKALAPPTLQLRQDQPVRARLDPRRLHVFSEDGEALLSAAGAELFQVVVAGS
jgi:ABC-type sugar transport system ATPase subunit